MYEQMTGFKQKGFFITPSDDIYIYDFYFKCITSDDRIGSKN